MAEQSGRVARTIHVSDHIWEAFGLMADEMGTDRDGLVNQALFAFARQNGYLTPGQARPATLQNIAPVAPAPAPAPTAVPLPIPVVEPEALAPKAATTRPSMQPYVAPAQPVSAPSLPPAPVPVPLPPFATAPPPVAAAPAPTYEAMVPLAVALEDATPATGVPAAVIPPPVAFETFGAPAGEEPLPGSTLALKPRAATPAPSPFVPPSSPFAPAPFAAPAPAPTASYGPPPTSAPDLGTKMSPDEVRAAQERVLQKAAELERLVRGGPGGSDDGVDDGLLGADEGTPQPSTGSQEATLVLFAEGREVDRVTGAPFLIGRGKHCDLIINSGKVSREHARIVREGEAFFIEDLGSSNGTWFDKKRITRRRVEHGDEYFICSEKLTCHVQ